MAGAKASLTDVSSFSLAKRNTEVEIASVRRCLSIEYLRDRVEADRMQEWAELAGTEDEPELPPFTIVGESIGEWRFLKGNGFYRGQWTNNLAHGLGTRNHGTERWEYSGLWMNGVFAGSGVISRTDDGSEAYAGEWTGGQRSGFGVEDARDHSFAGTWSGGQRGRFGALRCNAFLYIGTFHGSHAHGLGKESEPGGGVYMGQFRAGKRHGAGVWIDSVDRGPRSSRYEGEWATDVKEGFGIMRLSSGLLYKGEWVRNQRSGYGVVVDMDNRTRHSGRWEHDELTSSKSPTSTKVADAVTAATKAATMAREQSLAASRTARVAEEKVDKAEVAAQEARAMAEKARGEWAIYTIVHDLPKVEDEATIGNPDKVSLTDQPFDHPDEVRCEPMRRRGARARGASELSTMSHRSDIRKSDTEESDGMPLVQWILIIFAILLLFAFSEDLFSS